MKRLVSTVTAIIFALLLCTGVFAAESPDAYTVYRRAMKKLDAATTIRTTAEHELFVKASDYTDSQKADVILTQTKSAGNNLQMEARMSLEDEGNILYVYYKGGYYYQRLPFSTPDIKRKTKMSEEKAISECYGIDRSLGRGAFKDATLETTDDGYIVKYKFSGKDFGGMYANYLSAIFKTELDGLLESDPLTTKNSNVTYTLNIGKNGALKSYKISFVSRFNFESPGDYSVDLANRISGTVTTDDKAAKIKYPTNLDVYREIEL